MSSTTPPSLFLTSTPIVWDISDAIVFLCFRFLSRSQPLLFWMQGRSRAFRLGECNNFPCILGPRAMLTEVSRGERAECWVRQKGTPFGKLARLGLKGSEDGLVRWGKGMCWKRRGLSEGKLRGEGQCSQVDGLGPHALGARCPANKDGELGNLVCV